MLFYNSSIPAGWALCDGRTVARTDGGGNIVTPNLVNRFVYGGSGADWAGRGSTTKTLAVGNLPAHSHGVTDNGHRHPQMWTNPGGGVNWINNAGQTALDNFNMSIYTGYATTGISIQNTGNGDAFDIMPPYVILCYIMKH
jgi:microcystin-dependent protein